ncbi:MAG: aspartate carbamoyltransferase regulatory subunit [Succinatimonas sp.]|nr:aspartate carbamoyltransferase regulatory subunit [Succinatimonas sp.]
MSVSKELNTADQGHLMVEAISNGTVIDHIAPGQAINILRMFKFLSKNNELTVGFNVRSGALGKKDLIKIANVVFSPSETGQLSILAPNATVNEIKDYKVVDKYKLRLPRETVGDFKCPNSNCITHIERGATPRFLIRTDKDGKVMMRCHYCEREFSRETILEYNGLEAKSNKD